MSQSSVRERVGERRGRRCPLGVESGGLDGWGRGLALRPQPCEGGDSELHPCNVVPASAPSVACVASVPQPASLCRSTSTACSRRCRWTCVVWRQGRSCALRTWSFRRGQRWMGATTWALRPPSARWRHSCASTWASRPSHRRPGGQCRGGKEWSLWWDSLCRRAVAGGTATPAGGMRCPHHGLRLTSHPQPHPA